MPLTSVDEAPYLAVALAGVAAVVGGVASVVAVVSD